MSELLERRDAMAANPLAITEVNPTGSSGGYAADWFEVTNTGSSAVDITGWKMDDNSNAFASSVALRGISSVPAGKSVIFLESDATGTNDATVISNFCLAWFGYSTPPVGVSIGTYGGTGIGLGSSGDAVNLFNSSGTLQAKVTFGAATTGVTFDNAQLLDNTAISTISSLGTNGAYRSLTNAETGSPGTIIASATTVDLSNYVRIGRYDLPEPTRTTAPNSTNLLAQEVSAVTYNWDTDTLFVLGDGGTAITQVDKTGQLINSMTLAAGASPQGTTFYDPEGLTYIGDGKFVMVEERDRQAIRFTYAAGTTLTRDDALTVKLGTSIGNIGLEGITYDPQTSGYIPAKEISPQGIFQTTIDFVAGTASNGSSTTINSTNLFDPTSLGLADLADIFSLSNIPNFNGFSDFGNLLVLSQESGRIVETNRSGVVLSTLNIMSDVGNPLSVADQQHEGLTMDRQGRLYVVSENGGGDIDHPQLWVYAPSATPNQAPTEVQLSNALSSISESTSTASRVKVANIIVTDDGLGTNDLAVIGTDANFFEILDNSLYLKAGVSLNAATKSAYTISVTVDDTSVGATPDATSSDYTLAITASTSGGGLVITEVAPWSSGNSPVAADWFEVTNTSGTIIDITGWKMDDNSNSFASAVALSGVTTIAPGESVVFIESSSTTIVSTFLNNWLGVSSSSNLQIGTYSGTNVGLSTSGDAVNLYNALGTRVANVSFGASSSSSLFRTFENAIGDNNVSLTALSTAGVHGAFAATNSISEIGSPGSIGRLFVSEVAAWSSGNSPVAADWFELTNTTASAINLSGWKIDDSSNSFALAGNLAGINSIAPGESVIFLETTNLTTTKATFLNTWFGSNAPGNLQIGAYTGSGLGLSTGGDAVNVYDSSGVVRANVVFGASTTTAPYRSFDNAAALNNTTLATLSTSGVNGAFAAINDSNEVASPGMIASVNPFGPTITESTSSTFIQLPSVGIGYLSGVVNDSTDIPQTTGIDFTLSDPDTAVANLTVSVSSSNLSVVSNGGLSLTGSGANRNLRITPTDVGYSIITVSVTDGVATSSYSINYAASAASATPAATRFFTGASDASAAVAIDSTYMIVGDDEDQVLRLYDRQQSGLPISTFDLTSSLGLTDISGGGPREVDLEAAAKSENRIYWLGSSSNSSNGDSRPNRNRVFATDIFGSGAATTLSYAGRYDYLRDDLIAWDQSNAHGLGANHFGLAASAAAGSVPELANGGGFNIEGLVFAPGSSTTAYVGLRAPLASTTTRTLALLVPVTNFSSLAVSGNAAGSATFGAPIQLNLGGRGIRDLSSNGSDIVIIAGSAGSTSNFALYTWDGAPGSPAIKRNANLTGLNPEAIVEVPGSVSQSSALQLLSDNGDTIWYGDAVIAKDLSRDEQTKFRGDVVTLGTTVTSLAVNQAAATIGGTTTLQATLTLTDAGTAVSGKTIDFRFQGSSLGTATTDVNGLAKLTVNLSSYAAGLHANGLSAVFSGDSATTSSSSTANLIITPNYLEATVPGVNFTPLLSVGDNAPQSVNYRMVGIPDGLGAYDNGDGSFTVLMTHEINSGGATRAHGGTGSFVSKWTFDKTTLATIKGEDLMTQVRSGNPSTGFAMLTGSDLNFTRFCSADLSPLAAFYNSATGLGTTERLFLSGEETSGGRAVAHVVSGATAGTSYTLPNLGTRPWENLLANPGTGDTTFIMANEDGSIGSSRLIAYVGTKQAAGNVIERAGLTNGSTFEIQALVNNTPVTAEDRNHGLAPSSATSPIYQGDFRLVASGGTGFNRAEDGAWDPRDPKVYYFVTTDQATVGARNSRLWKLTFSDLNNLAAGGTIQVLVNGKDTALMFDNISIDRQGKIMLQEDPGNNARISQIWMYDTNSGGLVGIGRHSPTYFQSGVDPSQFLTQDEESSGVIDVSDILGDGTYLLDVQAHYAINSNNPRGFSNPSELVEGGQLLLMRMGAIAGQGYTATSSSGPLDLASNPAIIIGGTNSAEQLKVNASGSNYQILLNNISLANLSLATGQIIASGYGGNDTIDLSSVTIRSRIHGGAGNDQLRGGKAVDIIFGEEGNDALFGNSGNDELYGGAGDDSLTGNAGSDRLQGDAGRDTFLYDLLDLIVGYLIAENDRKIRIG